MFTSAGLNDPSVFMYPDIDFSLLPNLKHLNISRIEGNFTNLPASIQSLQKLESLDVSHNSSMTFPDWLFALPNLKEIYAYGVLPYREKDQYMDRARQHNITLHCQARSSL